MQQLFIAGTCGRDAELRRTQGGDAVLSFSLAVDNGKDRDGNKRDATWFDCSIWGKRAEALQNHITKGLKLTLSGRPTARAHNDKAYMGISVNELTFQGSNTSPADGGGYGSSSSGGGGYGGGDLDDEIPL